MAAVLGSVTIGVNAQPPEGAVIFQMASINDQIVGQPFRAFPVEIEEEGGPGGRPQPERLDASMTATFSNIVVTPGAGIIGGDLLEFDVTITNTSADPNAVLTAFAFQSKFSESPAIGSRIGDKLFSAVRSGGTAGPMTSVKKNGTSNGLFSGKWKGICINSSVDFLPEFNAGLDDESLECAGARTDDGDGEPELDMTLPGLAPGESQTVRLSLDSGTTDGALHRVPAGTLIATVTQRADGFPEILPNAAYNVARIGDFTDNKVFFNANGTFNPSFAPAADGFSLVNQQYLTLPRVNYAFTDVLGRNHTCGTYGLTLGACSGGPGTSPLIGFLDDGDLVPGVENFAAILQGFGEYVVVGTDGDGNPIYERPNQPYNVLCENCGGRPFVPIAEFYRNEGLNEDGVEVATRQIVAGTYGELGTAAQYTATIDSLTAEDLKQELVSGIDEEVEIELDEEEDGPGAPDPEAFGASADAWFHDLDVQIGGGLNGGDVIEFTVTIKNTSPPASGIYLTALNYQTKERGLADISRLDGTSQDRRDIRLDSTLPACTSLADGACFNASLGVGHFPNVIGNGLLFGQMVWTNADAGREPTPVDSDQVYVDSDGINPPPFWLESVKKNGPFTPILKGNRNFICIKSGLFDLDPDADAACAGQPAILANPDGVATPANVTQRLGLPPGQQQSVRMRMDFGDFRGVLLELAESFSLPAFLPTDPNFGLRRFFDCSDQRELEFCHPDLVGTNIGYLPGTTATWLTPEAMTGVRYVIANQPGDAAEVMNFEENFGLVMAMAGFRPSAEFYKPDNNPELPPEVRGTLIREQVLGSYDVQTPDLTTFSTGSALSSADWTGSTSSWSYHIQGGALHTLLGGPIYWKQEFGNAQEAAVRLVKRGKTDLLYSLILKAHHTATTKGSGIIVSYEPQRKLIAVDTVTGWNGLTGKFRRLGSYRAELKPGQELRARALANGSVRVFIDGVSGPAFQAGSAFIERGGRIGMIAIAPGATFDDFGGGTR